MQLELLKMVEAHNYGLAVGYAATSIAAGYVAVLAATGMVRRVRTLA
jgi:CrcB protein